RCDGRAPRGTERQAHAGETRHAHITVGKGGLDAAEVNTPEVPVETLARIEMVWQPPQTEIDAVARFETDRMCTGIVDLIDVTVYEMRRHLRAIGVVERHRRVTLYRTRCGGSVRDAKERGCLRHQ